MTSRGAAWAVFALAFILLAGLLAACGGGDEEAAAAPPPERAQPVETGEARVEALSVRLASVGSLEADNIVDVRPEADGTVAAIAVDEGDTVRRGDLLVRLDSRETAAELAAADAAVERHRAELDNLATRLERNRGLFEKGAISRQALDDLEADQKTATARLNEAEAQRDLAARQLDKTVIRAPFTGKAGARSFYVGDYVSRGDRLFSLVDDDPLKVEFTVPEQYVDRLDLGSPVDVRVRSLPGETFQGEVVFVSPRVDPGSRTVAMKAAVPNADGRLRPGQFADVELEIERRADALVVAEAAIVPRGGENFVFVVDDDDRAHERKVELGARETGKVEIRSGVEAGERVVVAGQQRLREGSLVTAGATTSANAGEG
ncbi:MAG TPA: efflux RND transporter periplasmic adaptor subunit [Thermoanaerobaculia bacterium]|nr:efflux RND transporter periplasmic adaptor subunit [Thermoanaerobaculia bacterium]